MKNKIVAFVLLFSALSFGQSVTAEAKAKLSKERHDSMVEHAKSLLQTKESLEAQLASVEDKLKKLDNGEDVSVDSGLTYGGTFYYLSGCGPTSATTLGTLTSR